jgi:hypothetical protein
MSDHDMDAGETISLGDTIHSLRTDVEVSDAWRARVLREVESLPTPRRSTTPRVLGVDARTPPRSARQLHAGRPRRGRLVLGGVAAAILIAAGVIRYGTSERGTRTRAAVPPSPVTVNEYFSIAAPGAARVSLVGDFNRWQAGATPLSRLGDGESWGVRLALPPGRHVYAFVVDGKLVADPSAPRAADDDFGFPNSVALVAVSN